MVVSRSDFVRTEFYADYADRHDLQDCMQGRAFGGLGYSGYVAIARSERVGAFESEEMRLLRLLLPHLRRAMRAWHWLAAAGIRHDSVLEALDHLGHGVLIADAQARVLYANGAAEAVLRQGDALGVDATGWRLRAANPGQTSALRRLIAQAAGRGGDALSGEGGSGALWLDRAAGAPLLLSVAPMRAETAWNVSPRPAALILIKMPEPERAPAPVQLRARYGLTPMEAAVAGRILQGEGAKEAARALGIAPSTLRWHLQRVFEKTGTSRQAELVRLLLTSAGR